LQLYLCISYYVTPRDLPSFPTRRSSDLPNEDGRALSRAGGNAFRTDRTRRRAGPGRRISHEARGVGRRLQHGRRDLEGALEEWLDRKSTRLNSSHLGISYAVFCLKKKKS